MRSVTEKVVARDARKPVAKETEKDGVTACWVSLRALTVRAAKTVEWMRVLRLKNISVVPALASPKIRGNMTTRNDLPHNTQQRQIYREHYEREKAREWNMRECTKVKSAIKVFAANAVDLIVSCDILKNRISSASLEGFE